MKSLSAKLFVYPLIVLASIGASGLALAESPTVDSTEFKPTRTRAEVITEYYQARANGGMRYWGSSYNPLRDFKPANSRDEIKAQARLLFDVAPLTGEDSGSFLLSQRMQPQRLDASSIVAASGVKLR